MLPKTVETVGIVYNACYGGFSLSHEAVLKYLEYKGVPVYPAKERWGYIYYLSPWEGKKGTELANLPSFYDRDVSRHDQTLVRVVREMGEKANGNCAKLAIEEVNKGTLYRIDEYDGYESVVCQYDDVWQVAE